MGARNPEQSDEQALPIYAQKAGLCNNEEVLQEKIAENGLMARVTNVLLIVHI